MKRIALIGSTGSVGRQAIEVALAHPDRFRIVGMAARASSRLFERQINLVKPQYAALSDAVAAEKVTEIPSGTRFSAGEEATLACADECGADVVFVAASGFAGLGYSLRALGAGKDVALANKETLVCGGDLVARLLARDRLTDGAKSPVVVPVDSEHSAIWQCLHFERKAKLKNLIITASGGPFRDFTEEQLALVTPEQALRHPTWKMGKKITVDSATLLNKGYEVIEAHHLYGTPYEHIKTVIQPQSIVHSMVEFGDGAILAQMSRPTMEVPIQLALSYPERLPTKLAPLDFSAAFSLEFLPLVRERYPLYDLALRCGEAGGVLPTALNAASEEAVNAFLGGKISFTDLFQVTERVVSGTQNCRAESYDHLCEIDRAARIAANKIIGEVE